MDKLTRKEFETYCKVGSYMAEEGITEDEINNHLSKTITLEVEPEDDESRKCLTLKEAAKFMGVSRRTVEYAYCTKTTVITRRVGGVKVF